MSITSATIPRQTRERVSRSEVKMKPAWALLAAITAVALAYLPVLLIYLPQLWSRQYYQFFPFAFLATIVLAVVRADRWTEFSGIKLRWIARGVTFLAAETLLALGIWSGSPWPCFVAFIMTIGILLDFWKDVAGERTLVYLILPLLLVIRPPLHLDEAAVQGLQTITSQVASAVLNGIGIDHLLTGNVIEPLSGEQLLVEQACSGVQSLFTLMFIAAFMSVYRRYTLARTIALTASAVVWALMMNIFRVVAIVVAQTQFQTDLSTGWQHELVGYAGLLLAIGALLSTDRLLLFLLGGIPDLPLRYAKINVLVSAWNWLMVAPEFTETTARSSATSSGARKRIGDGPPRFAKGAVLSVFGLAGIALISATPAWGLPGLVSVSRGTQQIAQLQSVDSTWLDAERLPGCSLVEFGRKTRDVNDPNSIFGLHSDEWMCEASFGNVLNSMDHMFDSWHDLTVCYKSVGWQIEELREVTPTNGDSNWPAVYAEFVQSSGKHAHLCFSLFTLDGTPVLPTGETAGLGAGFRRRLKQAQLEGQPVVQVQSLNESIVGLTEDKIQQLIDMHGDAREQLRGRVIEATQEPSDTATASAETSPAGGVE
jgi:exosortase